MSENGQIVARLSYNPVMRIDDETCYRALTARDARFDGLFFVGVTTTGIYCRPICTARTPGRDRCRFFSNAALAERDGFRPCLRCRPELAPGHAPVDAVRRTARAAAAPDRGGCLERRGQPGRAGRRPGSEHAAAPPRRSGRSSASRRSSWPRRSGCCWPSSCSPSRTCRSSRWRSPAVSRASGGSMRCFARTTA